MGKAIPAQHPAVVLRSHYRQLRALLVIAMIGVVGLTAAVVILATNEDHDISAGSATQLSAPGPTGNIRYDGGPEEGSRSIVFAQQPSTRYDGGPEEGTAALTQRAAPAIVDPDSIERSSPARYDGGPDEGTRGALSSNLSSNAAPGARYDGGPEEGSRGSGH